MNCLDGDDPDPGTTAKESVSYVSINRHTYSWGSLNWQFPRLSHQFSATDNGPRTTKKSIYSFNIERRKSSSSKCRANKVVDQFLDHCVKFAPSFQHIPAIKWMREYSRRDLALDLLSGLTIAVFHVPECMGYSFLADIKPIYCLYSSFFPTLIYALMGTSPHCSVGTFAALAIMTGSTIHEVKAAIERDSVEATIISAEQEYDDRMQSSDTYLDYALANYDDLRNRSILPKFDLPSKHLRVMIENEDIAFACAFIVGCYLLVFGLFRLGFLSVYMSEQFLNGFTCAVAYHVLVSQFHHMLGIAVHRHRSGSENSFIFFRYFVHIYYHRSKVNAASCIMTLITIASMLVSKLILDPWIGKRFSVKSFPIEFVIVLIAVICTHLFNLVERYRVPTIGPIESGLPQPLIPDVGSLLKHLWRPCISIAVVSYSITYSVGRTLLDDSMRKQTKQLRKSHIRPIRPEIRSSQELVALGCCNLFSSFFRCMPSGASLSRSAIQLGSGGRTQLVSIVNCAGILVVLYASSFFESLPNAILATIISVALRDLLANVRQFKRYWMISHIDASVWLVTFLSVIIVDINWGLVIGFFYSLLTLVYKSQLPPTYLLGTIDHGKDDDTHRSLDFFVPLDRFVHAKELPGIKIFQFCGPLNFANVDYFVSQLESKLSISIKELIKLKATLLQLEISLSKSIPRKDENGGEKRPNKLEIYEIEQNSQLNCNKEDDDHDSSDDEDDEDDDIIFDNTRCRLDCSEISMINLGGAKRRADNSKRQLRRYRRKLSRSLPNCLVIDCSMFSYIDIDGLKIVKQLIEDFDYLNVPLFFGGCPSHVERLLEQNCELEAEHHRDHRMIYISMLNAVEHARQQISLHRKENRTFSSSKFAFRSSSSFADRSITENNLISRHDDGGSDRLVQSSSSHTREALRRCNVLDEPEMTFADSSIDPIATFTARYDDDETAFSSLFSATTIDNLNNSFTSDDSMMQQLTVQNVIDLPHDRDCHSMWIEEEGVTEYDGDGVGDDANLNEQFQSIATSRW